MQTAFGSAFGEFDRYPVERAERQLLETLRAAVAEISIKELAFRLNVQPSLLADALAERSNKGVRASWLVTIIEQASEANAVAILNALIANRPLEVTKRKVRTPEEELRETREILLRVAPLALREIDKELGR